MKKNICMMTDSYKFTHYTMYPPGTEKVYSYFESRTGAMYPYTVFFGLQYLLKEYFVGNVVTEDKINEAYLKVNEHFGKNIFNYKMWYKIVRDYNGKLPLKIKAVPEGMPVPINNVMMTIENTDPECYSLTNFCETILSHVWAPSTVATKSRYCKELIKKFLLKTDGNIDAIDFMLNDFGYRGATSNESAGLCGAGHLINFKGADTYAAINVIMDYYNTADMPGFSIPATEHSIMTSLGKEGEINIMRHILEGNKSGLLAWVIDSYDYKNFITIAGTIFKDDILSRDGKLIFRPDSGDPCKVSLDVIERLDSHFGHIINQKGYKILNGKVGVLWGDGIDVADITTILNKIINSGWAVSNIAFGMGGGLLQKINRDTQRNAFKSSYQIRNGKGYNIFKDPLNSNKKSKSGKLMLVRANDGVITIKDNNPDKKSIGWGDYDFRNKDILETVFLNGELKRDMSFDEVKLNAKLI